MLFIMVYGNAFSQDTAGADDPFNTDEFDASVKESIAEDTTSKPEILFGGSFVFQTEVITGPDFGGYASSSLSGKPFVKISDPRLGAMFLSYNLSNKIFQATNDSSYILPSGPYSADNVFVLEYSLSEFFIDFDFNKAVYIRAGNQINSWGASFFWTPVDFVNLEQSAGFETLDLRQGIPAIKTQIPFPSGTVTLLFDFTDSVESGNINNIFYGTNAAVRIDAVLGGFAWGLTGFINGTEDRLVTKYGFDAAGSILGFDIYTEHAMAFHYTGAATITAEFDGYSASIGFERTAGELSDWIIRAEFFYNSTGTDDTQAAILDPPFTPFSIGKYYAFAGISKQNSFADFVDTAISAIVNFSDLSFSIRFSNTFSITGVMPLKVSIIYFGGEKGDEFTLYKANIAAASIELQFVF